MSILLLFFLIACQMKIIVSDEEVIPNIFEYNGDVRFTDSYIPAGMQVLSHYVSQLEDIDKDEVKSVEEGRAFPGSFSEGEKGSWYDKPKGSTSDSDKPHKHSESRMKSLVTALNREAKRQDLGKYQGFSGEVISDLENNSKSSSKDQLKFILDKISKGVIKRPDVKSKVGDLLKDLDDKDSEISKDLDLVDPLPFLSL